MTETAAPDTESKHGDPNRGEQARIRCVVFDYGNVVSLPQGVSEVEDMASVCGLSLGRFHEQYWRFRRSYDRGDLSEESYWASVTDGHGPALTREELARVLTLDGQSWAHPNPKTLEWAKRLKREEFEVAILSNMPRAVSDYLGKNCRWLALFDHCVYSGAVGCAKPELAIYKYCLDTLRLAAREVLFLDDRPENVKAASELGIHSLVFDTLEHTSGRAAIEFGLPLPSSP
jgi:putative hydrolase of the HAD superfamily